MEIDSQIGDVQQSWFGQPPTSKDLCQDGSPRFDDLLAYSLRADHDFDKDTDTESQPTPNEHSNSKILDEANPTHLSVDLGDMRAVGATTFGQNPMFTTPIFLFTSYDSLEVFCHLPHWLIESLHTEPTIGFVPLYHMLHTLTAAKNNGGLRMAFKSLRESGSLWLRNLKETWGGGLRTSCIGRQIYHIEMCFLLGKNVVILHDRTVPVFEGTLLSFQCVGKWMTIQGILNTVSGPALYKDLINTDEALSGEGTGVYRTG